MFTTIKSFTFAASVSLLALTSATAAELPKVSEISVDASYDAAQDSNAAALYPELQTDINKAVAEMVPISDDAADPTIRIDIRKIALDGDTYLPDSAEFNQIEGVVAIEGRDGSVGDVTFPVNIVAATADTAAPEGYFLVPPSTEDFYTAMVYGFAKTVAEELARVNTSGDAISR
ncbi:hypothetical protein [Sulfitobacter mediterraneus]|uniref:hypothetical protein n=1 Tax=Sulfitobacter mediterraneus TaxID=83219 RepID=UPI000EA2614E|nr:hypothetical protein [Sulfitobacter mediterraneus]